MMNWEYHTLHEPAGLIDQQLNELGAIGWEVVSATPFQAGEGWVWATLLRREIPNRLSGVMAHHADQREARRDEERADEVRARAGEGSVLDLEPAG